MAHEMYQITWRPAKQGVFPDRPASPTSVSPRRRSSSPSQSRLLSESVVVKLGPVALR